MDIQLHDILEMKKPHPCGEKRWQVLRIGMDLRLKCLGCGHEVMSPRFKVIKNIRSVYRDGEKVGPPGALPRRPELDGRNE